MIELCDYERKVLAAFAGNTVDSLRQGAALNHAAENLIAWGYMGAEGNLRDKGFAELGFKSPMRATTPSTGTAPHPADGGENGT